MAAPSEVLRGTTAVLLGAVMLRLPFLLRDWRRGRLPATRLLLPLLVLAEGAALVLPGSAAWLLRARLATALGLELLLLALAVRTLRRPHAGAWPEDRLGEAFAAFVPPKVARLMAMELVLLGAALGLLAGGWRKPAPPGFSTHREMALRAFLPALPLLIPGDILLLHVLAPRLAPWLRWTLHGATAYAVLWLFGLYATVKARPHQIRAGEVSLHKGLLAAAAFPAAGVTSVAPLPDFADDWARHAHLKGVPQLVAKGAPLLELTLAGPVRVRGLLGLGRPTRRLVVSVDDPAAFAAALSVPCP